MTGKYSLQLRFPGGIMPLRELRRVAMAGISHGTGQIYAGDRQQFRLPLRAAGTEPQVRALLQGLAVEHTVGAPLNIVSNALSMRSGTPWLSPGRFQGTLDSFNKSALRIPVDLIDPLRDGHLPGYGSLRFYAHEEEDFWIPAVRTAHSQGLVLFPGGVRNAELPLAAEALEPLIRWRRSFDMAEMLKSVERAVPGGLRPLAANGLTHTLLPRSEREVDECRVALPLDDAPLSCALLEALCLACDRHGAVQAGLTASRELVFTGLSTTARAALEVELVRYQWRPRRPGMVPVFWWSDSFAAAGAVARQIVSQVQEGISPFAGRSVACVVEGEPLPEAAAVLVLKLRTGVSFARRTVNVFCQAGGLGRWGKPFASLTCCRPDRVGAVLKDWIMQQLEAQDTSATVVVPAVAAKTVHACRDCLTQYDAGFGDPLGGVPVGTPFEDLADSWSCPVCAAPRAFYKIMLA